jgi:molybdopterin-guanine dinucleotide biosynthesis protein A
MTQRFISVTGFVLAGGASRRMGRDKATLILGDETLLSRQVRVLRTVCRKVVVVGPARNFPELAAPVVADVLPGRGPLGGIYTGLLHTRTEYNLVVGCDLPFLEPRFLRFLCERALESRADFTVAQSRDRKMQPLCAVWRRRILGQLRRCLEAGKYKASGLYRRAPCRVIPWPEVQRAGFAPRLFVNLNTPTDYEGARRSVGVAVERLRS